MRRIGVLAATGVLLAAGATTGVVAIADDGPGRSAGEHGRSAEAPGHAKDKGNHGYGPPSWAGTHGHGHGDKAAKHDWKEAWQALTPAQRQQRMDVLAAEHAAGMKAFGECVKAAEGERGDCEKPLPPGLAKRQS